MTMATKDRPWDQPEPDQRRSAR